MELSCHNLFITNQLLAVPLLLLRYTMRLTSLLPALEILALAVPTNGAPVRPKDELQIGRRWPDMSPGEALWIILLANARDAMVPLPDLNDREAYIKASAHAF
ncbi:hypothetical protein F5B20DRAFT_523214 [Whalleya microplaca]|nr:hypothetical protein F5B20DRAFT_523214 [Whalleya microplaca]